MRERASSGLTEGAEVGPEGAMFRAAQLEKACRVLARMRGDLCLRFDPGLDPEDKLSLALHRAARQVLRAAPHRLELRQVSGGELPCLEVQNVRYRAVPFGPELGPFLELLVDLSSRGSPPEVGELAPAELRVLIAPTCPNCPGAVSACAGVAATFPQVRLEVVDAQYYPDLAGSVRSVPTVIVDSGRSLVGGVSEAELLEVLTERSTEEYVQQTLRSMVETGRFSEATALLADRKGQAAMAALLARSTMADRIGLMLAAQEALAASARCMDGAVEVLLPLLGVPDANLRGDVAYLLGRIGAPAARSALERLRSDPDPDVREVAADSLGMLRKPS